MSYFQDKAEAASREPDRPAGRKFVMGLASLAEKLAARSKQANDRLADLERRVAALDGQDARGAK